MIDKAEQIARRLAPSYLDKAHAQTEETLKGEIDRLHALRQVNPNVREEEITFFEQQYRALEQVLDSATPRLDAVRVIVTT